MLKSYVGWTCPFCVTQIQEGAGVLICSVCAKPHHSDCWMYNLNRCTTFGCKGQAEHPEFIIETLKETESAQKIVSFKPSTFKPVINNRKTINKPERSSLLSGGPRSVSLKPIDNMGKTLPKHPSGYPNPIRAKKRPKFINKTTIQQRKIPELNKNGMAPRPDPYIPDYVFEEFLREKGQPPASRRFYKPEVIRHGNKNTPTKYSAVPKPDPYIPDYVSKKLKAVKGWTTQGNGIKRTKSKPVFNYSKLDIQLPEFNFIRIQGPEPFIPDYVFGKLPVKRKKKKNKVLKNPTKNSLVQFLLVREYRAEYQEMYPKPEPFIPDYVYAEPGNTKLSLFPKHIISAKRCPHCEKNIDIDSEKCPFCKKYIDEKHGNYSRSSLIIAENISVIKPEANFSNENNPDLNTLFVNAKNIKSVCFSPDGKFISFGSSDKTVRIIDIEAKECVHIFNEHSEGVNSVCFSPNGLYLASGSSDKSVKIWTIKTGECFRTFGGSAMGVESITYSPDSRYIVTGSGYGTIKVWDISSQFCLTTTETASPSWLNAVTYSPVGPFIASCNSEPMVNIWDVMSGDCLRNISGHFDFVNSVVYSPDGLYLASGSNDRTVKVWDIINDRCLFTFTGHEERVNSVSYRPDGRYIASGSNDKTIKIWEVGSGTCVRTITGHSAAVTSVKFSPDGKYIASGSNDKTIRIWKLF
jgi:WD40 repeat protein